MKCEQLFSKIEYSARQADCVEKWLEDFKNCYKSKSDLEHVQVQLAAVTQ